jgi:hypothetical protein
MFIRVAVLELRNRQESDTREPPNAARDEIGTRR